MSDRSIAVFHSDTHAGMKFALLNPETVLEMEDEKGNLVPWTPELTASQKYLWKIYTEQVEEAFRIADGAPMLVGHLGDECDGNKYPQSKVSSRLSDQIVMADFNARPWFKYPQLKFYRQVVGTQAHNFGEGSSGLLLCNMLWARYPGIDIKPLYHGLLTFGGVSIDYAHHGPYPGSRDWLKGNVARFYLRDLMIRSIKRGENPPRLVLRGHYHQSVHEMLEDSGYLSELYVLPSYSMLNDHAVQATQSADEISHGLVVFEIEDGKILREHRLYKKLDIRTKEELL
jgi:hypothetical protein